MGTIPFFVCDNLQEAGKDFAYKNERKGWHLYYNAEAVFVIPGPKNRSIVSNKIENDLIEEETKNATAEMQFTLCVDNMKGGFNNINTQEIMVFVANFLSSTIFTSTVLGLIQSKE
jgi:hypothetical protein